MANENDDFAFIKERIKERPINRKKLLMRIGGIILFALIFGAVAGTTFAMVKPWAESKFSPEEEDNNIKIPRDEDTEESEEETESETETETDIPETEIETEDDGEGPDEEAASIEIEIKDIKKYYAKLYQVATDASQALVTVKGQKSNDDADWLDNIYDSASEGSGLIVAENDRELFILTELSIVNGANNIVVTFADGSYTYAGLQAYDSNTGLAIVKLTLSDLEEATRKVIVTDMMTKTAVANKGDAVIAIGSPIGANNSVLYGFVAMQGGTFSNNQNYSNQTTWDYEYNVLHTDILGASNSSGFLINYEGQVVGMIAQRYSADSDKRTLSALGINQLKTLIEKLSNGEAIPYLGIKGAEVTDDIAEELGLPKGLFISDVNIDSPAYKNGIQSGGVLVSINGEEILTLSDYKNELSQHSPGDEILLEVKIRGIDDFEVLPFEVILE